MLISINNPAYTIDWARPKFLRRSESVSSPQELLILDLNSFASSKGRKNLHNPNHLWNWRGSTNVLDDDYGEHSETDRQREGGLPRDIQSTPLVVTTDILTARRALFQPTPPSSPKGQQVAESEIITPPLSTAPPSTLMTVLKPQTI